MSSAETLQQFLYSIPPWQLYVGIAVGFSLIYFSLAALTYLLTKKVLPYFNIGEIIDPRPLKKGQIKREIKASFISILIFSAYGVITLACDKLGVVKIVWQFSTFTFVIDMAVIFLWNEAHFYFSHRLLHHPLFYKRFHLMHHQSIVPTPFSTYSFHWFEALLLSSVMITLMCFYNLSITTVLFFPVLSLIINNIGHMNYAIFPASSADSLLASCRRHTMHHSKFNGNYGFLLPWLDKLFNTLIR